MRDPAVDRARRRAPPGVSLAAPDETHPTIAKERARWRSHTSGCSADALIDSASPSKATPAEECRLTLAPVRVVVAAILAVVCLVHLPLVRAYWCGYDDFHELARTAFEDARDPARVLTTAHDRFSTDR